MVGVAHKGLWCVVEKMSKDVGWQSVESIVVSFFPCLVAFWDFITININVCFL